MKNGLRPWIADRPEKRAALIIAFISLALVAGAFVWPLPEPEHSPPAPETTRTAMPPTPRAAEPVQPAPPAVQPPQPKEPERPAPRTPAPVPEPKPAPAKPSVATGYYIQIGAFKDAQRAKDLAGTLRQQWQKIQVVERPNRLHAVWVGPYPSRALAKQDQPRLARAAKTDSFIIKH